MNCMQWLEEQLVIVVTSCLCRWSTVTCAICCWRGMFACHLLTSDHVVYFSQFGIININSHPLTSNWLVWFHVLVKNDLRKRCRQMTSLVTSLRREIWCTSPNIPSVKRLLLLTYKKFTLIKKQELLLFWLGYMFIGFHNESEQIVMSSILDVSYPGSVHTRVMNNHQNN